MLHVDRFNHL